jgi:hypothetical protein
MLEYFAKNKYDFKKVDITPAIKPGNAEVLKFLVSRGVPTRAEGLMKKAFDTSDTEIAKLFSKLHPEKIPKYVNLFLSAEIVDFLIQRGGSFAEEDVFELIKIGRDDILKILLRWGWKPSEHFIAMVSFCKHVKVIRTFLEFGVQFEFKHF